MKNKFTLTIVLTLLLSVTFIDNSFAQTQAEIEAMQNGSSSEKKESKEKLSKEAQKLKKDAEKAQKELDKANAKAVKNAEKANKQAEKDRDKAQADVEETVKEKPKKEKTKKGKTAQEKTTQTKEVASENDIKEVEKEESPKKEKAVKEKASKPAKTRTSARSMNKPLKTWSIDVGVNATNPQTDIRYNDFFGTIDPKSEWQYGGQLRVTKMFDNAIGVQMQFAYNRLQGVFDSLVPFKEDRDFMPTAFATDGIYFKNNVYQGSINLYWNISNTVFNINKYYRALSSKKPMKKRWFSLYAYSGIGITFSDPHVMRLTDDRSVEDSSVFPGIQFQTDASTEVVVPLALGAKIKLNKTIDLGLEYGYNFLFSDKLDGFNYNHQGRIKNDGYTHASLVLTVKLGSKKNDKEHIEWSNAMEPVFEEIAKIDRIEKKVNRLAQDEDEDGVSDYFDADTETPEGTTVGADGRALDIDGDGVIDDNDMELFTGKGAEVDENGRAIDTDKDGVPDYRDAEDGTSAGDITNFQGRTIKVKDAKNEGFLRNLILPSIFFDTDRANIKREYEDELFQMALTIKRNEGLKFILEGHCDERGSDEYNIALGNRRAEAVKNYLVENYKLDPAIFSIVSKGRAEILSPRYNINRRVDVIIAE